MMSNEATTLSLHMSVFRLLLLYRIKIYIRNTNNVNI